MAQQDGPNPLSCIDLRFIPYLTISKVIDVAYGTRQFQVFTEQQVHH